MYEILKIDPPTWKERYSANARLSVFGEILDPEDERIDFALLTTKDKELVIYTTLKELSRKHVYLCFGGSFPNARGKTSLVRGAFLEMLSYLFEQGYEEVTFSTKNTNYPMQRLSMHAGFVCVGISICSSYTLLEYNLKKEK